MTGLHYACKNKNLELIKILIENKSDLDARDFVNRTPLFYALLTEDL